MRPKVTNGMVSLGALSRALVPLGRNLAGMYTRQPLASAPAFVTWALTERCPMRCLHCDMGRPAKELDHAERLAFADALGRSSTWGVSLIGGEVTLVPELAEYAARLTSHGKYVTVGTSGWNLGPKLDALLDAGIDALVLSVDHHRAKEHDALRGRPGLFQQIEEAVARVRARPEGKRPSLQVRCTVHRLNYRHLFEFIEHWRPRVDNIILQIVQDNGIHHVRDRQVLFQPEDRAPLERTMELLRERYPFLRTRHYELASRYVYEPKALQEELDFRCLLVPATSCTVLPDGGVKLCYGRDDSLVGNVREQSLEALWTSELTRRTQARMQAREYDCMCWEAACSGNLDLLPVNRGIEWALETARLK